MPDTSFPREARLRQSRQFRAVFKRGQRFARSGLVVIAAPDGHSKARIGLALAKRHIPRAVDRNRVKRVIRESFRCSRDRLGSVDVVVLARYGTGKMSNRQLFGQLRSLWSQIAFG